MKKIYIVFPLLFCMFLFSCQSEDITNGLTSDMGYLRLNVNTSSSTTTKGEDGLPEGYDPKQLFVAILDAKGNTVQSTDDFKENWGNGKSFQLKVGTYTITANSNGFDGSTARHGENPYYAGDTTVVITAGKEIAADLVCRLADVKITVQYESSFVKAFSAANVKIRPEVSTVTALNFPLNGDVTVGYLPVSDFTAGIQVTNMAGVTNSKDTLISGVQARDHYIFIYRVDLEGDGKIEVEADDSQRVYTYIFPVTTTPSTSVKVESANAWSNFAYLSGTVTPKDPAAVVPAGNVTFEYQLASADEYSDPWTILAAEADGTNTYKATLKNLTPGTSYRYRLVCEWDGETPVSSAKSFTTETQTKGGSAFNWSFENWYQSGKHWYAATNGDNKKWDSGNEGANTISEVNPTRPEYTTVVKGTAAKLFSTTAVGQFAAGSLFTGDFGSATINPLGAKLSFGTAWACKERPTQLTGYYKYNPGEIDKHNEKVTAVKKGNRDLCSIYIALLDWTAPFAVSTGDDVFFKPDDSGVIAYGELSADKTSPESMSKYEKFTIDLKYRDLNKKPTYILVVCSSSKYGDYFTGSTNSVLYLDEFDLIYGEPVIDTNYITESK